MMLIVRLYPTKGMASLWRSLEKNIDSLESDNYVALYASQLSGKNFISVIFEIKEFEDIEEFYTKALMKIPNIRKTETLTMMKTRYFDVPKDKPKDLQRFLVHFNCDPKFFSQLYERIATFKFGKNVIMTYLSYSFGEYDLLVSILTDGIDTTMELVEQKFNKFPGVQEVSFTHVIRSMLLVGRDKWKEHQARYMAGKGKKKAGPPKDNGDWGFDESVAMSGGFTGEK